MLSCMIHKLLHFKNEIFLMIYIYILYHSDIIYIYICHAIDLKSFSVMAVFSWLLVILSIFEILHIQIKKGKGKKLREKKEMDNNIEDSRWQEKKNYN